MVAKYRGDYADSGYYPSETGLTPPTPPPEAALDRQGRRRLLSPSPIVANNLVYWGDWNGIEHATNLAGTDEWTTNLGVNTDNACFPPVAGVSGTATAAHDGLHSRWSMSPAGTTTSTC